jgi:hypothetical protein
VHRCPAYTLDSVSNTIAYMCAPTILGRMTFTYTQWYCCYRVRIPAAAASAHSKLTESERLTISRTNSISVCAHGTVFCGVGQTGAECVHSVYHTATALSSAPSIRSSAAHVLPGALDFTVPYVSATAFATVHVRRSDAAQSLVDDALIRRPHVHSKQQRRRGRAG